MAGGKPNGAILDDTAKLLSERKKRFAAWRAGYRDKNLKENPWTKMYKSSPHPIQGSK